MVIALWIIRVVVALVFFVIGGIKAIRSTAKHGGVEISIPLPMRLLGGAEVLGALGLILPVATGIAPVLTIAAAVCLGIVMVGATIIHLNHKESPALTLTLLVLLIFTVIGHLVWVPLI